MATIIKYVLGGIVVLAIGFGGVGLLASFVKDKSTLPKRTESTSMHKSVPATVTAPARTSSTSVTPTTSTKPSSKQHGSAKKKSSTIEEQVVAFFESKQRQARHVEVVGKMWRLSRWWNDVVVPRGCKTTDTFYKIRYRFNGGDWAGVVCVKGSDNILTPTITVSGYSLLIETRP